MRRTVLIVCCLYFMLAAHAQTSKKTDAVHPGSVDYTKFNDKSRLDRLITVKRDVNENKLDPQQFRGHYILLNFYDRNADSAKDTYSLKLLYALQAKTQNLKVIRIARLHGKFEDVYQGWKDEVKSDRINIAHVLDNQDSDKFSATDAYNIKELPMSLFLDSNGKIINSFRGYVSDSINKIWSIVNKRLMSNEEATDFNYITEADELMAAWNSTMAMHEKEKLLSKLNNSNPYTPGLRAKMYLSLVQENIRKQNIDAAQASLSAIEDREIYVEGAVLLAQYFRNNGLTNKALDLIGPLINDIRPRKKNAKLRTKRINDYSKLATMYCRLVTVRGNEELIIELLRPLFETCEFFPGDKHAAKGEDYAGIDSLLTYKYAMALSTAANSDEVARVIASYINADPAKELVKQEMLKHFSHVKDISIRVDNNLCTGREINRQNLFKLFLKKDLTGTVRGLNSVKSKYILIDFWGSWCSPCRASHPNLKDMYKKYKDKGLEIVGIAAEFKSDLQNVFTWKRAVAQDGITWIQYLNPEGAEQFDAFKEFKEANNAILVQKLLLDRDGNFIGLFEGKDKDGLNKKLAELMP